MRISQRITQLDIELVVINVVQEHVHTRQVVGGVVELLPPKAVFNDVGVKMFFGLQQQRARTTRRVINLVDTGLLVHCELCNQLGHVLRGEELATRFTGVGGVVGDQELVGIAEQVNVAAVEITKVKPSYAFEHGSQTGVFVDHGIAEAVAGGIKISKQAFYVALGGVAVGRAFNSSKESGEIGIQAFIRVGAGSNTGEQLAWVDEVALGFNGIVFDVRRDDLIGKLCIADAVVTAFDVAGKVFTDKAIKQGAQDILLEIPAVNGTSHIVGDLPDLAL